MLFLFWAFTALSFQAQTTPVLDLYPCIEQDHVWYYVGPDGRIGLSSQSCTKAFDDWSWSKTFRVEKPTRAI